MRGSNKDSAPANEVAVMAERLAPGFENGRKRALRLWVTEVDDGNNTPLDTLRQLVRCEVYQLRSLAVIARRNESNLESNRLSW